MLGLKLWPLMTVGFVYQNFYTKVNEYFYWCTINKQQPILDMYPEGYDLYENNAWEYIEHCSKMYKLMPKLITSDWHADYPCDILKSSNHWMKNVPQCKTIQKQISKKFGHFIGRISWDRLMMHNFLMSSPSDVYFTFWSSTQRQDYVKKTIADLIDKYGHDDISMCLDVLQDLPKTNCIQNCSSADLETYPNNVIPLQKTYSEIFVDIVHETEISNNNCFYTEKTIRPMLYKTPFITMHGKGSLRTLQTLGFKTFDKWWSEDYDQFSGKKRLQKIKKIIKQLQNYTLDDLKNILNDMQNVLEYNHGHLITRKWSKQVKSIGVREWHGTEKNF